MLNSPRPSSIARLPLIRSSVRVLCDAFATANELSRHRRHAACITAHRIDIVDTTAGRSLVSLKTPCASIGQRNEAAFLPGRVFRYVCKDSLAHDVEVVATWPATSR